MASKISKIAILTSGGDSPGMNTTIRAVVKQALARDMIPYLVHEGYRGLVENMIVKADPSVVDSFNARGGTFIGTARLPGFKEETVRQHAVANLKKLEIGGLVVIGGDGSYIGAKRLTEMGINCIGLPGTIDNDLASSDETIGFDTALNTVVDAVDKLRDTCESHKRCVIVEVMGRYCGDLTVFAGLATGAEMVVTSENPQPVASFVNAVNEATKNGKRSVVFLVAEHIYGENGAPSLAELTEAVQKQTGKDTRFVVLGHVQRGGVPTAMERVRATRMGVHAVELLAKGIGGRVVGNRGEEIVDYEIIQSLDIPRKKRIELINLANAMNIK